MSFESIEAFRDEAALRGYRKFTDHLKTSKSYLESWQKKVMDGDDTLYFVSIDVWDISVYSAMAGPEYAFEANTQFHTEDNLNGDFVNVLRPCENLEEIEAFFAKMFDSMEFGAYERSIPTEPLPC